MHHASLDFAIHVNNKMLVYWFIGGSLFAVMAEFLDLSTAFYVSWTNFAWIFLGIGDLLYRFGSRVKYQDDVSRQQCDIIKERSFLLLSFIIYLIGKFSWLNNFPEQSLCNILADVFQLWTEILILLCAILIIWQLIKHYVFHRNSYYPQQNV